MHFHWIRLHWCFRAIILNICPWILYFCENNEKRLKLLSPVALFKINYECFVLDFQFCMDDYSHILEQNLYVVLHVHHILHWLLLTASSEGFELTTFCSNRTLFSNFGHHIIWYWTKHLQWEARWQFTSFNWYFS